MARSLLGSVIACLCGSIAHAGPGLLEAREGFTTNLVETVRDTDPLQTPPPQLFELVKVPSSIGPLAAYLSKPPGPGKHPAMVWITGGLPPGGIGSGAWQRRNPRNDQSAKAYREAGLIMLYPTVRGTSGNPGAQECFFGEVNDVLAAIEYVSTLEFVDPKRIYLGGHSTGGTLALLVAAASDRLAGVIAFGPVGRVESYGDDSLTYDSTNKRENELRAPIEYLDAIGAPTWVIEGNDSQNVEDLARMQRATRNRNLHFIPVRGASHFDVLAPTNALIAERLAKLEGESLELSTRDVQSAYLEQQVAQRESSDLRTLAGLRLRGIEIGQTVTASHYLMGRDRQELSKQVATSVALGFRRGKLEAREDRSGQPYFVVTIRKQVQLTLDEVFATSRSVADLCLKGGLDYSGWDVE